ncbi:hypothetical protein HS041_28155 [Planomonospora sp. ID67723]|uniref:hypothetical protein n=1 Tax=Planomonospora sp. ID67723 TaxID=2738134 RepID=UPI0018C3C3D3|nr:hypothetical protein [Planomonospora sp. ID67723]MBG0831609.1 hypothetical protein [Planomonospora sp. ID67723]
MSAVDPAEAILRGLGHMQAQGRTYPGKLPDELERWYGYTLDGGHSIMVLPVSRSAKAAHGTTGFRLLWPAR